MNEASSGVRYKTALFCSVFRCLHLNPFNYMII